MLSPGTAEALWTMRFVQKMPVDGLANSAFINDTKSAVMKGNAMNMRAVGFAVAVAAGLSGSLSVSPANAGFITGQLSISGNDIVNYTLDTITFGAASDNVGSGDFVPFVFGTLATMRNVGTPLSYAGLALTAGSDLTCGTGGVIGGCFFQTTIGVLTAGFELVSYTFAEDAVPTLTISGSGLAYLTGFTPTPAIFSFTTQGDGSVSFSATMAVPGPVVGAGLPGLILACGGLIALARRRRTRVAV